MATYYLLNTVKLGLAEYKSGKLVDSNIVDTAALAAVGAALVTSSNAVVAAAALVVQKMWADGKGQEYCDGMMFAAYAASKDVVDATSPACAGRAAFYNPLAAELISVVNDVQMATGALVVASQPNVPCKLQVRITDAADAVTGTCVLVGVGADGSAITQTIPLTGGTRTVVTADAYATLTSATLAVAGGAGVGKNIGIGVGAALGLPIPAGATGVSVFKATCDYANEAVGTVDATARTVIPTTGANGAHDYEFFFKYTLAHTHTLS